MKRRPAPRTAEEVREDKRQRMATKRAANPQAIREYQRSIHHRNRERNCEAMREYYGRRFFWGRAMKLRGTDRATTKQLAALWKTQRGRCAMTGRRLTRTAHLDHIIAKARGGNDGIGNLRWVCPGVNLAKRDLSDADFVAICEDVMRYIGKRIDAIEKDKNLR